MPTLASTQPDNLKDLLNNLESTQSKLTDSRDILLANTVMIGEIPAPTHHEEGRIKFLQDRFTEAGLQNVSTDEVGNAVGILPGSKGDNNILLTAHADTPFEASIDHTMFVQPDKIVGPGIGDNSLGLATIASLPFILEKAGISFEDNLILLGTTRSLGRGDIQGLKFFLENTPHKIHTGICVEGVQHGRLSYTGMGMLRGIVHCQVPSSSNVSESSPLGAIGYMARIINKIKAIPIPQEPRTYIILGSMNAGTSFNTRATKAQLRFEVRSEQAGMVTEIQNQLIDILSEQHDEQNVLTDLEIIARRSPGGIPYAHPLVKTTRSIMKSLNIEPIIAPSVGELSALIANNIPSVTIGLTKGSFIHESNETIYIEPIYTGLTQLITLIQAIDQGACDEQH